MYSRRCVCGTVIQDARRCRKCALIFISESHEFKMCNGRKRGLEVNEWQHVNKLKSVLEKEPPKDWIPVKKQRKRRGRGVERRGTQFQILRPPSDDEEDSKPMGPSEVDAQESEQENAQESKLPSNFSVSDPCRLLKLA